MKRIYKLTILVGIFFIFPLRGNTTQLPVQAANFITDLSEESVLCVFRDSRGYLWVGTYIGLYRTDGSLTEVFLHDPDDKGSIGSSVVFSIFESSDGHIYFGTQRGLDSYSHNNGKFTHHIPLDKKDTFTFKEVRDIAEDREGNLWLATYNHHGLIKYNPQLETEEIFWLPDNEEHRLNAVEIAGDSLWVGSELQGLYLLELENERVSHIVKNFEEGYLTINDIKIRNNHVWCGTWNHGLMSLNPESLEVEWYHYNKASSGLFKGNNIRQIDVDHRNNLWLAVYGNGVAYFNPDKLTVSQLVSENNEKLLPQELLSWCIYEDDQNILWIGSIKSGLRKAYPATSESNYLIYENNSGEPEQIINVNIAIQDMHGNLWLSTRNQGLIHYNLQEGHGKRFKLSVEPENSIFGQITFDKLNRLWVTSNYGLYIIDLNSLTEIAYLNINNSFLKELIHPPSVVFCDNEGDVWISSWQAGLARISYQEQLSKKPYDYISERYVLGDSEEDLLNNGVQSIFQTSDSNLWISGAYFIQNFSKKENRFKSFALFDGHDFVETENGSVWITSDMRGLVQYIPRKEKAIFFEPADQSFPKPVGLFSDDKHVWVNERKGLTRFRTLDGEITRYMGDAGVKSMQYSNTAFSLADGRIFLGGIEGCYIYDLTGKKETPKAHFRISNLFVYNELVKPNDTIQKVEIYNQPLEEESKFIIPSGVKSFSFEFSSIDFTTAEESVFAYKLKGQNTEWNYLKGVGQKASFNNLLGGNYEMLVARVDPYRNWQDNVRTLSIQVLIPFYKTNWFRFLVFFVITTIGAILIIIRHTNLKKKNLILEREVSERTKELQNSNTELAAKAFMLNKANEALIYKQEKVKTQANEIAQQKNEIEKKHNELTELNATKDKFFSIIAHDLISPFNSILGFHEILEQEFDDLSDLEKKEMIQSLSGSSKLLFNLVENLLYWARSNSGGMQFKPTTFDFMHVVDECLKVTAINCKNKGLELVLNSTNKSLEVLADEHMLNFIVRNLLNNAVKFTPTKGKIELLVKKEGGNLVFSVKDNGVGMSRKAIKGLFKVEAQKSTLGTNNEKGTGLGLILCKQFVDQHKGSIRVESEKGSGAEFIVEIPE